MNTFKRVFAIILVLATMFTFVGCHKKNEVAVTVDGVEFTSAYYMCALVFADSEARSEIDAKNTDTDKEIDYYSEKIDGKKYVDFVKDKALSELKKIAAYKIKCKEAKLELEDEEKESSDMYASYYWSSYGYQQLLEPNGVSEATYKQYMLDSGYSNLYFEHLYGEGGEKEIPAKDVEKKLYDNFLVANVLEGSFANLEDAQKTELENKFNTYLKDLKEGKRTFEAIYKEYNQVKDEQEEHDHEGEEPNTHPMDEYATILGSKDTETYASDHYDTVKGMKIGEIKLVKLENDGGLAILIKKDIKADPYYKKNLDITVRHLIGDEEFEKTIDEYVKTLKIEENKFATKQFKVKKIAYPETTA